MQPLDLSRLISILGSLGDGSRRQVERYLELIGSRNYADGTLRSVVVAINRFLSSLPAARRSALGLDFTRDDLCRPRLFRRLGPRPRARIQHN